MEYWLASVLLPFCISLSNGKGLLNDFILYFKNQCISKLDKIGIFIYMKFH